MRFRRLSCARTGGRWLGAVALAVAVALGSLGCVRAERAADRQAAAMQEAIGDIQAERDRVQSPLDLESDDGLAPSEPSPRAAKEAAAPTAPLRTVTIGESEETAVEDADPDAPGSRPEIRLHGTSRYGRGPGPSGPKESP